MTVKSSFSFHSLLLLLLLLLFVAEVGNYNYGPGHPMKPHRIRMAHSLIVNYGIDKYLQVLKPPRATIEDISRFHSDDYVLFLQRVTPETVNEIGRNLHKYNVGDDCPVFEGLFEYCQIQAGGSIGNYSIFYFHLFYFHLFYFYSSFLIIFHSNFLIFHLRSCCKNESRSSRHCH